MTEERDNIVDSMDAYIAAHDWEVDAEQSGGIVRELRREARFPGPHAALLNQAAAAIERQSEALAKEWQAPLAPRLKELEEQNERLRLDQMEDAQTITDLQGEIERLRAALERIRDLDDEAWSYDSRDMLNESKGVARHALASTTSETNKHQEGD